MVIITDNNIHNILLTTVVVVNNQVHKKGFKIYIMISFLCTIRSILEFLRVFNNTIALANESISIKVLMIFYPIYGGPTGTWLDDPYILIQGFVHETVCFEYNVE